jgi:hypothetical protein
MSVAVSETVLRRQHAAFVKRSINYFGFKFRYPDERDDAAISQGALNVDEKIKELIEIGSFDYELFKFTPHGDEILVTEIPQCSRATPEGNPADIDQAAEAASERKPDVEISNAEDFAAGVRDPDERPESDDEGGVTNEDAGEEQAPESEEGAGVQPDEDASEGQAPSTQPNEAEIAEFLTIISNYAKQATDGMPDPGVLQLSKAHPDAKLVPQRFMISDVDHMVKAAYADAKNGHNVYTEPRTVRLGIKGNARGKLEDTVASFAVVMDSDNDKGEPGYVPDSLQPTLIVESSHNTGNAQLWFVLAHAVTAEQGKELGELLRKAVGADSNTGTVTQPYRVAGTVNFPNAKKRERGRVAGPTRILEHSGKVWTYDELREALEVIKPARKEKARRGERSGRNTQDRVYSELGLKADLLNLIVNGVDGDEEDRSRKFFGVVARLKRLDWPVASVVELFEKYPDGIAAKYQGRMAQETERVYNKITDNEAERLKLPIIYLKEGELTNVVRETEDALKASGKPIFTRGDCLVHPVEEECRAAIVDGKPTKTKVARLRRYTPESLLLDIGDSAQFKRFKEKQGLIEEIPADPPMSLARLVLYNPRTPFPRVAGIITTPLMRLDGSILSGQQPHYDAETQLYYVPTLRFPPIPEKPAKDDAIVALKLISDLLAEFPWIDPELDRAVALSAMLTPLVRASMETAPLHLLRACTPGTGKSYLVDMACALATGNRCPVITWSADEEENRKALGAMLLAGMPVISIDNVKAEHPLGGDMLCQATERPLVRVRILGKSETPDIECRAAMLATGNNAKVVGDMTRRAVICNLDADTERPELRKFKRDPLKEVIANRGRYVAAALTIIRAYIRAGAPSVAGSLGSYSDWDLMVRWPLVWLGQTDPAASMEQARAEDDGLSNLRTVFDRLKPNEWLTAKQIIEFADTLRGNGIDDLFEVLWYVTDNKKELSPVGVGKWLSGRAGNVIGNKKLRIREVKHTKQYLIETR